MIRSRAAAIPFLVAALSVGPTPAFAAPGLGPQSGEPKPTMRGIRGTLLVDEWVELGDLHFDVWPSRNSESAKAWENQSGIRLESNRDPADPSRMCFLLEPLPDCSCDLRIVDGATGRTVLFEATGISPGAMDSASDARLEAVDLRGRLLRIRLTIREADKKPVPEGSAQTKDCEEGFAGWWSIKRGVCELRIAAPSLDVEITAPGHKTCWLKGLAKDGIVDLEPGPRVRVVADGVKLPSTRSRYCQVEAAIKTSRCTRLGPCQPNVWVEEEITQAIARIDENGVATLQFSTPGRYHLTFQLMTQEFVIHGEKGDIPAYSGRTIEPAEATIVDVEDIPEPQTLRFTFSEKALEPPRDSGR